MGPCNFTGAHGANERMPFASHASRHVTEQVKIRCNIYERVKCTGPDSLVDSHEEAGSLDHFYNDDELIDELIGRLNTLS